MKYRRFRRRGIKKRFRRKRLFRRQRANYDNGVAVKIHQEELIPWTGANQADIVVNWAGNGVVVGTNYCRLTVTPEFTTYTPLYREYRVTGVRMQYIPLNNFQAAANATYDLKVASDTGALLSIATTDAHMASVCDFKMNKASNGFVKYVNVGKYMAKRNLKWLQTTANYPDVTTLFRVFHAGFIQGDNLGKMHVTWYVKFKSPQI